MKKKPTETANRLTYFLLSRSIFDSPIWSDDPHTLKIFLYLVGTARHDKKPKRLPGALIKRGELITSLSAIAENNSYIKNKSLKTMSRQKIIRILDLLEKQGYIKRISDTYGTHIKVCNYDTYQNPRNYKSDSNGTTMDSVWTQCGLSVDIYNNGNNDNNDNNIKAEKKYESNSKDKLSDSNKLSYKYDDLIVTGNLIWDMETPENRKVIFDKIKNETNLTGTLNETTGEIRNYKLAEEIYKHLADGIMSNNKQNKYVFNDMEINFMKKYFSLEVIKSLQIFANCYFETHNKKLITDRFLIILKHLKEIPKDLQLKSVERSIGKYDDFYPPNINLVKNERENEPDLTDQERYK